MKFKRITEVEKFLKVVDECENDVYLTSQYGDKFNLKSKLTQYVAIAQLLNEDNDLELWCDNKNDENRFIGFFDENPETL